MAAVNSVRTRTRESSPRHIMYTAAVVRSERLGPSFVRVTFTGRRLRDFGTGGLDQRIKLVLPRPGQDIADIRWDADWYRQWQAMPDDLRPTLRTYTVRAHRPELAELDIDFVLHGAEEGHGGPATVFAAAAKPGDQVGLLGPDRPGTGRAWGCEWSPPDGVNRLILAGDETAVPAMAAIIESLPGDASGIVCVEVPTAQDIQVWNKPSNVDVRWSVRESASGGRSRGQLLNSAVNRALGELCQSTGADGNDPEDVDVDTTALWEVPESLGSSAPGSGGSGSGGSGSGDSGTGASGPGASASGASASGASSPGASGKPEVYAWLAGEASVIKNLRRLVVRDFGITRTAVAFMGYWREGRC